MRTRGLLAAMIVLVLTLAGCVSPPSSGPIRTGLEGPVPEPPQPLVRAIANPPRQGMSPVEIVAGFLEAAAAVGDDFSVARQYLAPPAAADWNPGAGVTITASDLQQLTSAGDAVNVAYVQVGAISDSGVMAIQPPAAASVAVPVAQVDGQWRITNAPQGLLLSRQQVDRAFAVRNAYFVDPSSRWAVPDVRMVPRTGTQAQATALVTALLAGPSQWLANSVVTAIPAGLQLALGAVPVADGVARIELTGPQATLDDVGSDRFGAQFAWTLRQVAQVRAFIVFIDGREVPLAGQRGPVPLDEYASFAPDVLIGTPLLYGLNPQGAAVQADGDRVSLLPSVQGGQAPLSSLAVGPASTVVAGATADRAALVVGRTDGSLQQQRIEEPIASGPAIDGRDRVWWTDPAGGVRVATPTPDGGLVVAAVQGAPGPITLLRPARDGTRAVVIVGGEVYLAAVVEQAAGLLLQSFQRLGDIAGVSDVAWHSADQLTLLSPGADVVDRVDLLGRSTGAFAVPASTRGLCDAPGAPVVLSQADGTAGRLTGSGVRVIQGLTAPAYPG